VSGADTFEYYGNGFTNYAAVGLLTIKYASNGSRIWLAKQPNGTPTGVQVAGTALDSASNVYITFNWTPGNLGAFVTSKYDSNGNLLWTSYPDHVTAAANGVALDGGANVLLVGQNAYQFNGAYSYYYTVFKLSAAGSPIWTNHFPQQPFGSSAATAISVDSANNSYVTGYSPGTNSGNDIVTIKYGPNGNQIWLQRYHGPGSGNDAGNAIAVDNNGNVYVTGYEATAAGGTEMVLIKYSPLTLQKRSDGSFLLHAQGSPGEIFDIQASANLINWLDLGTVIADTNGLMQFADTNASNFTSRYYITNPQ